MTIKYDKVTVGARGVNNGGANSPTVGSRATSMANPAAYRKQTCYLCEMPRSPWAVLHDFTETICRSCVNYEGPDRIETILSSARRMRGNYGMQEKIDFIKIFLLNY